MLESLRHVEADERVFNDGPGVRDNLVEGRSQALENDVVHSMKQGNIAAPSRVVKDERIMRHFEHAGHRTAISQRALQAHADPWPGWCELDGRGQVVQELAPYGDTVREDHKLFVDAFRNGRIRGL